MFVPPKAAVGAPDLRLDDLVVDADGRGLDAEGRPGLEDEL